MSAQDRNQSFFHMQSLFDSIEYTTPEVAKMLFSTVIDPSVRRNAARKMQGRWSLMPVFDRLLWYD